MIMDYPALADSRGVQTRKCCGSFVSLYFDSDLPSGTNVFYAFGKRRVK